MQQKCRHLRNGVQLPSAGVWGGGCREGGSTSAGKTITGVSDCDRKALPLLGVRSIGRVTQIQETDRKPAGRSKASPFFFLQPCSPLLAEPNMELVGKTKLVCRVCRRIGLKLRNKSLKAQPFQLQRQLYDKPGVCARHFLGHIAISLVYCTKITKLP